MAVQTEWLEKDLYQVLGVPETATEKEIQRAYRRLARELHPDANPGNREAEERFKEVSAAYDVLGDAEKRKQYDDLRRLGPMAAGIGGDGGFGDGEFGGFRIDGLGDLFGDFFRTSSSRSTRGADLEAELRMGFEQAVSGLTAEVQVTSDVPCATCGGSGARPGTSLAACAACGGHGTVTQTQGFLSIAQTCPRCGGRGQVIDDPCPDCRGRGVRRRPRTVRVRVPAGIDDGQLIRVPGQGEPGRNGGPPGDLFVIVRVDPHPLFGRDGANLTLRLPVTYPEAVLGAEVKVPTIDGGPVTLRIPPGTPSGRTMRVRGHGVPRLDGSRGDLLVTIEVAVPTRISGKERKAVEELAKAMDASPRARDEYNSSAHVPHKGGTSAETSRSLAT